MSRELFVIEALPSVQPRRPHMRRPNPDISAAEWRLNPDRGLLGRTEMIGPFPDYQAAHRWLHWHHNLYAALIIHRLLPPREEPAEALAIEKER